MTFNPSNGPKGIMLNRPRTKFAPSHTAPASTIIACHIIELPSKYTLVSAPSNMDGGLEFSAPVSPIIRIHIGIPIKNRLRLVSGPATAM